MQCTVFWMHGIIVTISLAANVGIGGMLYGQKQISFVGASLDLCNTFCYGATNGGSI
jgi:hypothetical protein